MTKHYPSKVSYGLLIFVFLIFYGPLIPVLISDELNGKMITVIILLTLIFAFILHLFFYTQYTINNKELTIKCGLFSYQPINIDEIKEIRKTNTIVSSPAPSFDRIEIKYGKYNAMILSPKDKFRFADDLIKINPKIKSKIA